MSIYDCPDCGKEFIEVNGLYVRCSCGFIDDSTFAQITGEAKLKGSG